MLHKFIISIFLIIAIGNSAIAQEIKKDSTNRQTRKDTLNILEKKKDVTFPETQGEKKLEAKLSKRVYSVNQFAHETVLIMKQPTKWVKRDWIRLGIVVGATFAAMPFDESITNSTQGNQQYYTSAPIEGGRIYGEWYSIIGIAGAVGVYGIITHNTDAKKISIELLQSGLYAELMTNIVKVFIGRERPISTDNAFMYKPGSFFIYDYNSMPSGHTTSAFALSTILSRHANSTFLKILAYVPAGFTMFSRIYQHQHWLSDEVLGAAIGSFVGNWVVDLHEGRRHKINVNVNAPK